MMNIYRLMMMIWVGGLLGLLGAPKMLRAMETPSTPTTYRNQNVTITIQHLKVWSGVNNTGNVTYTGCDRQSRKCITLKGGTVSCRSGFCSTGWQNGRYFYSLQDPINEEESPNLDLTLKIFKDSKLIRQDSNFEQVKPIRR
jgi:hypothetical protein